MLRFCRAPLLALALLALPAIAGAHEYTAGLLTIEHPWCRATVQTAKVGAGYMEIVNKGSTPDRLVAVKTAAAGKAELHTMTLVDGVMQMRPLPDGIEIAPGGTVSLAPGGIHVMLMDLKAPLMEGTRIPATLVFEQAGEVAVEFKVEPISFEGTTHTHGSGS